MSYYIVGKTGEAGLQHHAADVFKGSKFISNSRKRVVASDRSFAYCYSEEKVIDDVLIELVGSDSWLLLTGAAVLNAQTENDRQQFATAFFANPKKVLRHQVDGHFSIIAYDSAGDVFLTASDWHSLIPVYFAVAEDGPLICSAELPLARILQCESDEFGFAQAVHYGAVWGQRTRFSGVSKLDPCEIVQIDASNNITRERYWDPQDEKIWAGSFDDVLKRWLGIMQDTIRAFTDNRGDGGVSSDITAGEDSRLIVALLHDLELAFSVRVSGEPGDTDVVVSRDLAAKGNVKLTVEHSCPVVIDDLLAYANETVITSDAYGSFFSNISSLVHEVHYRPLEYKNIHFNGMLGGAEYRGAYYPHAKVLFPSSSKSIDYHALVKRKFLLDLSRNLLKMDDDIYMERVYGLMGEILKEVEGFPAGTQVDHLIRVGQGCLETIHIKRPFYAAFGLRDVTRSIYNIPPHMKKGGRQFKAITEMLFPDIARVKTQAGVPTIRKTLLRFPLFIPEYYALFKKAINGLARQVLGTSVLRAQKTVNARHHTLAFHSEVIKWLFENEPYASWFRSADTMLSGHHYNPVTLNELLEQARQPDFDRVKQLGRVVNQEFAYRYVYDSLEI